MSLIRPVLERPVFIVGTGRSGTTLLQSILSAHPDLAIAPETHFMKRTSPHPAPDDFERFCSDYVRTVRFADLDITEVRWRELIAAHGEQTYETAFRSLLLAHLETTAKRRIGEKTPSNVVHVDRLLEWFPDARVLITRRDPRAVIASKLKAGWVRSTLSGPSLRSGLVHASRLAYVADAARQWRHVHGELVPRLLRDDRTMLVPYRDLVTEPEPVVRCVCEFIGEAFVPAMLEDRTDGSRTASAERVSSSPGGVSSTDFEQARRAHMAQSRRAISTASLDRWRDELSAVELAVIEGVCAPLLEPDGPAAMSSPGVRAAGRLAGRWLLGAAAAERRVRTSAGRLRAAAGVRSRFRRRHQARGATHR